METMSGLLLDALVGADESRPRSKQQDVGPSQLGGCRTQVWHLMNGTEQTNPSTSRLAAVMGTAIHSAAHEALRRADPWGDRFVLEHEAQVGDLRGHVDCYDRLTETVWDWKTTTKKNLSRFPSQQQRWQVHVYGWLMSESGFPVKRVGLVGIARDGHEGDVVEVAEPYDQGIAQEALDWLTEVRDAVNPPPPERDARVFCQSYCVFYGACPGKPQGNGSDDLPLPDLDARLVHEYVAAKAAADAAKDSLAVAKDALLGVTGRTDDGWVVAWAQRQNTVLDREKVTAALGEVPMKPSSVSDVLTVKREG